MDATYAPDAAAWLANGTLPAADHVAALVAFTGLPTAVRDRQFDVDYDTFRHNLIAPTTLGVYDGRMSAPAGSALDADDDPSNTFVEPGFEAIDTRRTGRVSFDDVRRYLKLRGASPAAQPAAHRQRSTDPPAGRQMPVGAAQALARIERAMAGEVRDRQGAGNQLRAVPVTYERTYA